MTSEWKRYKKGEISRVDYNNYIAKRKGFKDANDMQQQYRYDSHRQIPLEERKDCGAYLGINISEKYLSKIWDNVIRMPYGNRGYDFICGKGFKIDVKSSCIIKEVRNGISYNYYQFDISKNEIADYFLLITFDNRESLNPLHLWLIKGDEVIRGRKFNSFECFKISSSKCHEINKYEMLDKLNKLIECCGTVK